MIPSLLLGGNAFTALLVAQDPQANNQEGFIDRVNTFIGTDESQIADAVAERARQELEDSGSSLAVQLGNRFSTIDQAVDFVVSVGQETAASLQGANNSQVQTSIADLDHRQVAVLEDLLNQDNQTIDPNHPLIFRPSVFQLLSGVRQ